MKSYVICKKDFQYNDEIEYCEGDGGIPTNVFTDKEEAIKVQQELNAKYFDGLNVEQYCYCLGDILNYDKIQPFKGEETAALSAAVAEIIGRPFNLDEEKHNTGYYSYTGLPKGLPLEQLVQIADLFTLKFYELYEVED